MTYIGTRSGRWLVIGEPKTKMYERDLGALCRCDCGTERVVAIRCIVKGYSQSCGCANIEASIRKNTRHGAFKTRLYRIWRGMKERCHNPNAPAYSRYGGRGITVCKRWHDFRNFRADTMRTYRDNLTLDRINNNGPYSPKNCRWVTAEVQGNNRNNNNVLEFNGERMTCSQWARKLGMREITLSKRIHAGWSVRKALTAPVRHYFPR